MPRKLLRALLISSLAQASDETRRQARKGVAKANEFEAIPASDLARYLECGDLTGKPKDELSEGQLESLRAFEVVTSVEIGGQPYARIKWALHKVLDRLDFVGARRAEAYREAGELGIKPESLRGLSVEAIFDRIEKEVERREHGRIKAVRGRLEALVRSINVLERACKLDSITELELNGSETVEDFEQAERDLQALRGELRSGKSKSAAA